MEKQRSSFGGKIGFILAAAGSAVGLGNIWRFPYLAAKYGGGIFLLVYIILAVTFGFSLMCAEIAIGRKTRLSPIGAFEAIDSKFSIVGWLASAVPIIITPYYCVIGGWVLKYCWTYLSGQAELAASTAVVEGANLTFFEQFISSTWSPIFWFALFLGLTALVVLMGVDKGIEKVSKFMMPLLIVLIIGIAVYIMFQEGAMAGVLYYLKPDFSAFSWKTVVAAMGQMFYSMSLAMGIMITYGSYMKKEISIESSVRQISLFDTGIAFLAGLAIIPAVFACGQQANLNAGPSLMFITLPNIFLSMPGGTVVGCLFFLLVFFAALTSSISLLETIVSIFQDKLQTSRKQSILWVLLICVVLGLLSTLGYGPMAAFKLIGMQMLDFFDFISNSVMMPIVALLTCLVVGWVIKPKWIIDEVSQTGTFKWKKLFSVIIRWIAPVILLVILVTSVLGAFGLMSI